LTRNIIPELTALVGECLGESITTDSLEPDSPLSGGFLDSMAVTNLILAIEDHFRFSFEEEELTVESFETLEALSRLISKKLDNGRG